MKLAKQIISGLLGAVAAAALVSSAVQAAPIVTPVGLSSGESYRLVFVTSTATNATSSDINYYNDFVNDLAGLNPILAALGTTWTAIVSTAAVNARDNTATHPTTNGAGAPIYLLDGSTKIADTNADLWDTTIDAPINLHEDGTLPSAGFVRVWSGTTQTGGSITDRRLGEGTIAFSGRSDLSSSFWIRSGVPDLTQEHHLYALSGILTVSAIPAPGIPAIFGLGFAGLIFVRRNRYA